jgi:hypothetical protein
MIKAEYIVERTYQHQSGELFAAVKIDAMVGEMHHLFQASVPVRNLEKHLQAYVRQALSCGDLVGKKFISEFDL